MLLTRQGAVSHGKHFYILSARKGRTNRQIPGQINHRHMPASATEMSVPHGTVPTHERGLSRLVLKG